MVQAKSFFAVALENQRYIPIWWWPFLLPLCATRALHTAGTYEHLLMLGYGQSVPESACREEKVSRKQRSRSTSMDCPIYGTPPLVASQGSPPNEIKHKYDSHPLDPFNVGPSSSSSLGSHVGIPVGKTDTRPVDFL